jgi:peptidoglycan/LPS O-acetylase OafA/YrhL
VVERQPGWCIVDLVQPVAWPSDQRYVEAFDGVRAMAVLLVIAYHTRAMLDPVDAGLLAGIARNGWVGVDVFFTLSGFLITGILLRTRGQPGWFRNFYVRRILRIFPLYYGLVTLVLGARLLAGAPNVHPWWSFYAFVSNWFVGRSAAEDFALDVSWSLAIEEQFYLLWPAFVALAPRRVFLVGIAVIVLACPVVRFVVHDPSHLASYTDTWCRLDALAIGALAAVAWEDRVRWAVVGARVLAWPALGVVVALAAVGAMDMRAVGWAVPGYTVVAVAIALVLLALASDGVPAMRWILTWRPLVHVGRVSYGVYLLHPFVLGVLQVVVSGLPIRPAESAVASLVAFAVPPLISTAVATLVFRTVEAPILALKDRLAPYAAERS